MASRPSSADVRSGILRAATEAFERHGYVKTSLAAIAAEAGYTKGAVYSGFASKAALFAEVCTAQFEALTTRTLQEVGGVLAAEDGGGADPVERLAAVLTAVAFDAGVPWPPLLHEFQAVALRDPAVAEEYRGLSERRVRFLAGALAAHPGLAGLGTERLTSAARLVLLLVHTLAVEHRLTADSVSRETGMLGFTALLDAVLPAESAR